MTDAATFLHLASALPETATRTHFGRPAFSRRVIFATLAPDGLTANIRLSPADQQHWLTLQPAALEPVSGAWGGQGWTTVTLAALDDTTLATLLRRASGHAGPKPAAR